MFHRQITTQHTDNDNNLIKGFEEKCEECETMHTQSHWDDDDQMPKKVKTRDSDRSSWLTYECIEHESSQLSIDDVWLVSGCTERYTEQTEQNYYKKKNEDRFGLLLFIIGHFLCVVIICFLWVLFSLSVRSETTFSSVKRCSRQSYKVRANNHIECIESACMTQQQRHKTQWNVERCIDLNKIQRSHSRLHNNDGICFLFGFGFLW